MLLMSLELDRGIVSHAEFPTSEAEAEAEAEAGSDWNRRIFASPIGVSVVAESLNQMALTR